MLGTVKFFKQDKGYGFITSASGEFFFHTTQVIGGPLDRNDETSFELGDGRKGDVVAVQVQRVSPQT